MMLATATPRNPGLGLTWSHVWSGGYCPGCPGYSAWPMGPCSCEDLKAGPAIPGTPGVVASPPWLTPPAPQTERQLTKPGAWTPDSLKACQLVLCGPDSSVPFEDTPSKEGESDG